MIRTKDHLVRAIAEELVWRRKELTQLRGMIQVLDGEIKSKVLIRSAVALLYAHWEGFVKKSGGYYLEYVAAQRLTYSQLAPNFVALSLKGKFSQLAKSDGITMANSIANHFCLEMESRSLLPYRKGLETRSNLSSTVLVEILNTLGLPKSSFATRFHFIDSKLVDKRNHIAHGEFLEISDDDYLLIHDEVIILLELFRTEIENSAALDNFRR